MSRENGDYTSIRPALSPREATIAVRVARGQTDLEIGAGLKLGYETVRSYMKNLREKTGLRRKSQLAVWAAANGQWLSLLLPGRKRAKRKAA